MWRPRTWGVTLASMSFTGGAITDIFKKKLLGMGLSPIEVIAGWCCFDFLILLTISALFNPMPPVAHLGTEFWQCVLASATFSVTGSCLHALAIKKGGLVSVPFLSFNPAFSLCISSYLNGEFPSFQGMVGVSVVTVGALGLSYVTASTARLAPAKSHSGPGFVSVPEDTKERGGGDHEEHMKRRSHLRPGHPSPRDARDASVIMVLVGFFWASASSIEKRGLTRSHVQPVHFLLMQKFFMATPVLSWVIFQQLPTARRREKREQAHSACFKPHALGMLFMSACVDAFTVLTYFMSLELIYVSFALALKRAGGVLLAVLGGRILFKEVVTTVAWAAIMVMISGVILVVTS